MTEPALDPEERTPADEIDSVGGSPTELVDLDVVSSE